MYLSECVVSAVVVKSALLSIGVLVISGVSSILMPLLLCIYQILFLLHQSGRA